MQHSEVFPILQNTKRFRCERLQIIVILFHDRITLVLHAFFAVLWAARKVMHTYKENVEIS